MGTTFEQIKADLEQLAAEHTAAANNEYLWALGAATAEDTAIHIQNMEDHKYLARMYKQMASMPFEIMEQFGVD
jgi:hypothetical protein